MSEVGEFLGILYLGGAVDCVVLPLILLLIPELRQDIIFVVVSMICLVLGVVALTSLILFLLNERNETKEYEH